jgi:hypothetical protein
MPPYQKPDLSSVDSMRKDILIVFHYWLLIAIIDILPITRQLAIRPAVVRSGYNDPLEGRSW